MYKSLVGKKSYLLLCYGIQPYYPKLPHIYVKKHPKPKSITKSTLSPKLHNDSSQNFTITCPEIFLPLQKPKIQVINKEDLFMGRVKRR